MLHPLSFAQQGFVPFPNLRQDRVRDLPFARIGKTKRAAQVAPRSDLDEGGACLLPVVRAETAIKGTAIFDLCSGVGDRERCLGRDQASYGGFPRQSTARNSP